MSHKMKSFVGNFLFNNGTRYWWRKLLSLRTPELGGPSFALDLFKKNKIKKGVTRVGGFVAAMGLLKVNCHSSWHISNCCMEANVGQRNLDQARTSYTMHKLYSYWRNFHVSEPNKLCSYECWYSLVTSLDVPSIWSLFHTTPTPKWKTRYVLGCNLQPCTYMHAGHCRFSYSRRADKANVTPADTFERALDPWKSPTAVAAKKTRGMAAATKPVQSRFVPPSDPDL
jgi:hypothetical protein